MPAGSTRPSIAASLLIGAFGLVLILIVLLNSGLNLLYERDGRAVVGTVLYSDYARGAQGLSHRNISYTFTLRDGRNFKGHQTGYSAEPGQPIRIEYLAHHPWVSCVAGTERLNRTRALLIGGVGLLFLLAGLHFLIVPGRPA